MKPLEFVPPVVALAAAGLWLGSQSRSISSLVDENTVLRERIENARHAPAHGDEAEKSGLSHGGNGAKGTKKKIDWKGIALKQLAASGPGDVSNMRAMIALQKTLTEMSPEELVESLDEIASLDLPTEAKTDLESMLIGILTVEHPDLVVQRFGDRLGDPRITWQLPMSFQNWAKKDLAAATAWMDKQIADGKFESKSLDGKNEMRLRFEGGLIGSLLESDPAAAAARIEEIPENDRASLFTQGMFFKTQPGTEKAMVDLIRKTVPEAQRASTIASATASMVIQGGYERVSGFMAASEATAEERAAIVSQAFQNKMGFNVEPGSADLLKNFEAGRAWASKEAPEAINRITADSLIKLTNHGTPFAEVAKLAEKYHAESGSDEVLTTFFSYPTAFGYPEISLKLADKISDEKKREEVRAKIENSRPPEVQPVSPTR